VGVDIRNKENEFKELNNIQDKNESKQKLNHINEHFIFNTLNSILSLCRGNSEEARKVVLELSSYLRFNFKVSEKIVFLYDEIEYIKSYLYIQKVRFGDRLNIKYDIEEDINFIIPKNSLYNLIDNAVNHGILKRNHGGTITFMVKRDSEKVVLKISDDGVGMEDALIMKIQSFEHCGSILTSTSQFKDLYNSKLEVISKPQIGTYITLNIPIENIKCV